MDKYWVSSPSGLLNRARVTGAENVGSIPTSLAEYGGNVPPLYLRKVCGEGYCYIILEE